MKKVFNLFVVIFSICFGSTQVFGEVLSCQRILGEDKAGKEMCEKIGQMLIVGFGGYSQDEKTGKVLWNDLHGTQFSKDSPIAKHIAENHIGGVILFNQPLRNSKTGELVRDRNVQNPEQLVKLNQNLQDYSNQVRKEQGLVSLPLFIGVDQEGGRIDRLPAVQGFQVKTLTPQAFGAKEEKELGIFAGNWLPDDFVQCVSSNKAIQETYKYAQSIGQELSSLQFNLNFFPTVDVNVNPTNPIIGGLGRSFSSNPQVVIHQAKQFIKAFNQEKVIAVLKHFPGHGSSTGDSHDGLVDVTATYERDVELEPYYALIKEGYADMVMTTHVINGQIDRSQCKEGSVEDHSTWCPGTMSKKTLTNLLREEIGFQGIIVSDDMTMGAIAKQYPLKVSLGKAVNAGVDMFIIANNKVDQTDAVIASLAELVKSGEIKPEKISEIYKRISDFKKRKLLMLKN